MDNNINKIDALILEDHLLFAETFAKLIEGFGLFNNVSYFNNTSDLLKFVLNSRTNNQFYIFLDYYLNGEVGTSIIGDLRRYKKNIKIILISSVTNAILLQNLAEMNIEAIVHKSDSTHDIIDCFHALNKGETYYSPFIAQLLDDAKEVQSKSKLTAREIEIILYFAKGFSIEETAEKISLSRHTVSAHRRRIYMKTNSKNLVELLDYARKLQILD